MAKEFTPLKIDDCSPRVRQLLTPDYSQYPCMVEMGGKMVPKHRKQLIDELTILMTIIFNQITSSGEWSDA